MGSAFQKDLVVISAPFCIVGDPLAEMSWAVPMAAVPTKPCPGTGSQQGCPWTRVLGHIPFSKEKKSNPAQDARKDRTEGALHMHIAGAELALPPLGAKNTLLGHLTVMPEQSRGDSLAWGQGTGTGEGKTRRNNPFSFPPASRNALGWMGP